jgi:RNA polymerase sigma-70 factor, ECF subfamily
MQQLKVSVFSRVRTPGSSRSGSQSHYGVRKIGSVVRVAPMISSRAMQRAVLGGASDGAFTPWFPSETYRRSDAASDEAVMSLDRSSQHHTPDSTGEAPARLAPPVTPRFWIVPPDHGRDQLGAPGALTHDDVPDEALIAALVAGEPEALGPLYDRHARVVFSVIMRIAGDRDVAEEILQEVFLRAWQQAHAFDETRGTVRFWLHRIAHNLTLNELRRRQRRPQVQRRPPSADAEDDEYAARVDAGRDPAVDAWCAVRDAELAHALDQLPQGQRAVLLLYAEGFSQSEIAAKLGEPLGTVKSRMRRALCRLREALPTLGIDAGWRGD